MSQWIDCPTSLIFEWPFEDSARTIVSCWPVSSTLTIQPLKRQESSEFRQLQLNLESTGHFAGFDESLKLMR